MESLKELLVEELQDLYSAEKQIVKALPKIVKGSSSEELKTAVAEHLEATKGQVTRLEEVFRILEEKPKAKHCKGMEGLLEEGAGILEEEEKGIFRDLALIGAAQRVEHYEVAAYGTARAIAEQIGASEAVGLLSQTLDEEELADTNLTAVADGLYSQVEAGAERNASTGKKSASGEKPAVNAKRASNPR